MRYEVSELNLGGILDHAVALAKNHLALFFGISCVLYLPFNFFFQYMLIRLQAASPGAGATPEDAGGFFVVFGFWFVSYVLFVLIAMPITNAATIFAVASEYLDRPATVGGSLRLAVSRFLPLIGTSILKGFAIMLGLVACLIPGIYLAFRFWFSTHVVVLEDRAGPSALTRSGVLMKGNMGTAVILGLVIGVISWATGAISGMIPVRLIQVAVNSLVGTALFIFAASASVVFYFSCRCKAENFDLTVLADSVARDLPPASPSGPA
jgi:hypothetical protein